MIEFWKGGGIQNSLYFEYEKKKKTKQNKRAILWNYMYLKDTS